MATLESLELTIESNAQSAVQGVGSLIRSLSLLSTAIAKPVSGLMRLNAELEKLKKYGAIKMPTIGKNVTNVSNATNSIKKHAENIAKSALQYDPATNNNRGNIAPITPNPENEARWQREFQANLQAERERSAYRRYMNNFYRERERLKSLGLFKEDNGSETSPNPVKEVREATQAVNDYTASVQKAIEPTQDASQANELQSAKLEKVKAQTEKLTAQTEKLKAETEKIKDAAENGIGSATKPIERVTSSASRLLSRIGRIASTMLIRRAMNMMLQGAKEGLDNYYQYAKRIGLDVASTMDGISTKWNTIKNQAGAALGTALNTIAPILNTIASLAIKAFNAITMLFALLGGKSTYSQAIEQETEYAKATTGAAKATKDLLASFDELNVIQSASGGGGSTSPISTVTGAFEEVAIPQWLQEWKPLIEAILGGVLGALILPKIFDWIKKIFDLFGGSGAKDTLDILKRMFKLKDTDFSTPTDGVDKFLKKFTDSDVLDGVSDVADLLDTLKNLDWKTLLIKNLPELLKLAITALTKLLEGLNVTSKVKVDRKEFDEFKKDFEKFKNDNKTLSVAVTFDHTRSSDFWRDKKTIDDWCNKLATKSVAFIIDHTRSSDYTRDKNTFENWVKTTATKIVGIQFDTAMLYVFRMAKEAIDNWVKGDTKKVVGIQFDSAQTYVFTMAKNAIDNWVKATSTKVVGLQFDTAMSYVFSMGRKGVDDWVNAKDTKVIGIQFNPTQLVAYTLYKTAIDNWVSDSPTKTIGIVFDTVKFLAYNASVLAVDTWVARKDTKTIGILFNTTQLATFVLNKGVIDKWVEKTDTKYVNIKLVDNNSVLAKTMEWINREDTKVVQLEVKTTKKVKGKDGNFFDKNIFTTSVEEALEYFKNNDLATIASDFWESFQNMFNNPKSGKKDIDVDVKPKASAADVQTCINYIEQFHPELMVRTYNTAKDVNSTVAAIQTWVPRLMVQTYNTKADCDRTRAAIETWVPSLKVRTYNTKADCDRTVAAIETWVPVLTANVINTRDNMQKLMSAIETWHPTITASVITEGDLTYAAEGGLIESGDIFVANENGKSEMIGRFGSQAAVANQEQMVEAMARGVQYANAEQNGLLRRQNEILLGILQKEGTIRLGASSAFGRIASQSISMYERASGV